MNPYVVIKEIPHHQANVIKLFLHGKGKKVVSKSGDKLLHVVSKLVSPVSISIQTKKIFL